MTELPLHQQDAFICLSNESAYESKQNHKKEHLLFFLILQIVEVIRYASCGLQVEVKTASPSPHSCLLRFSVTIDYSALCSSWRKNVQPKKAAGPHGSGWYFCHHLFLVLKGGIAASFLDTGRCVNFFCTQPPTGKNLSHRSLLWEETNYQQTCVHQAASWRQWKPTCWWGKRKIGDIVCFNARHLVKRDFSKWLSLCM